MDKIKASIIVPVYNGAAYLAETLDSCLAQTESRIEIIVVDDGSTDSTKKLMEYYAAKDSRVKPIYLPENVGRSVARNKGIEAAESKVCLMLDSDDIALPDRVKETVKFFAKKPAIGLIYGSFYMADALLNISGIVEALPFSLERLRETSYTYIGHSTMAFRKSVYKKVQYSPGEFSINCIDDWKFQVDALKAGVKFGIIKKPLAHYRFINKTRDEKRIGELKKECLSDLK